VSRAKLALIIKDSRPKVCPCGETHPCAFHYPFWEPRAVEGLHRWSEGEKGEVEKCKEQVAMMEESLPKESRHVLQKLSDLVRLEHSIMNAGGRLGGEGPPRQ